MDCLVPESGPSGLCLDLAGWLLNPNSPSCDVFFIDSGLPRVERLRTWYICSGLGGSCMLVGLVGGVVHVGMAGTAADAPQSGMTQQALVGLTALHCAVPIHVNFGFRQRL